VGRAGRGASRDVKLDPVGAPGIFRRVGLLEGGPERTVAPAGGAGAIASSRVASISGGVDREDVLGLRWRGPERSGEHTGKQEKDENTRHHRGRKRNSLRR